MRQYLRDLAEISAGQGAPQGDHNYCDDGLPFVKAGNLQELTSGGSINDIQKVSDEVAKAHKLKLYPKGTVLFAKSGMSCLKGYVYVLPVNAYVVSHLACITPKEDISEYLRLYFTFHKPNQLVKDAAYPSISLTDIGNLQVDTKDEQTRGHIITVLKSVEEIIELRTKELHRLEDLIRARFVEMFGEPIANPKGWQVKRLKELSTLITNGSTPKGGSENYVDAGITFLRSQNVWRNRIELDDVAYIDQATHESMKKSSLHYKDILITKTGRINTENSSLGRAALFLGINDSANINGHVYLVRLADEVVPEYVVTILTGEAYRKYIRKVCVGGIDKRQINVDQVEDFPIIMPPIEQQRDFAKFKDQVDKSKVIVQKDLDMMKLLFDSLLQQYFG